MSFFQKSPVRMTALTFAHFFADFASSVLPGFLPAILVHYHLDLSKGVIILSTMGIGANLLQIPASKIGENLKKPLLLIAGILMTASMALFGLLNGDIPFIVPCLLMLLVGLGVALIHPNGLRGVRNLKDLPVRLTTPVYMTGGFLGASVAPWVCGLAVERFGMPGICILIPMAAVAILLVLLSGIRLSTEKKASSAENRENPVPWSFAALIVISSFMNTGTTCINGLTTYMMNLEHHFPMSYGGFATMLFGIGSSATSMFLGYISVHHRVDKLIVRMMAFGVPVCMLFLFFSDRVWALALAVATGSLAASAFPIFVAMSSTAKGKLGIPARMGVIVGGTWGIAGIAFLGIGKLADLHGVLNILEIFAPGCYLMAFLTAFFCYRRKRDCAGNK